MIADRDAPDGKPVVQALSFAVGGAFCRRDGFYAAVRRSARQACLLYRNNICARGRATFAAFLSGTTRFSLWWKALVEACSRNLYPSGVPSIQASGELRAAGAIRATLPDAL